MSKVSIVIPVYYNAASLEALADRLSRLAATHPQHEFEFVYVDDGSGDDSFTILQRIAASDARVRVIKLTRNFGSNAAILAGISYATGDCVGFVAADLQDPPETYHKMLEHWEAGSKVVLAMRADRHGDPWLTRLFAGIFNWLFKKLVFGSFSPQGVGFFLVDRQVADVLLRCKEKNAHLIGLLFWSGYDYKVVEYERGQRHDGRSRWTWGKKTKYFIDAFVAFSYLPLRLASVLGLLLSGLGGIYAVIVITIRFFNQSPVPGWTALMVVLLLTSGSQLLILGIIGEYLWRNFDATRWRPLFIVDSVYSQDERE